MATKTQSRSSAKSEGNSTGVLVGAAVAGAAVGLAANMGRKLFVQLTSAASGTWFDALKTEHKMTLALFDKLQKTDDSQAHMRTHLLMKIKYALTKHAHQEESVIYPALRAAGERQDADHLNADHGYVKTYLYELEGMAKDSPAFLERVAEFRTMLEGHIREEEDDIFPGLQAGLSDEKNAELTTLMNKEGLKLA